MRCYIRRYILSCLWLLCIVTVLLTFVSQNLEEPVNEKSPNSHLEKVPWGDTFHDKVKHIHGEDIQFGPHNKPGRFPVSDKNLTTKPRPNVWPLGSDNVYDRIVEQLDTSYTPDQGVIKKILIYNGGKSTPSGNKVFKDNNCAVQQCEFITGSNDLSKADAVLFQGSTYPSRRHKTPKQIWVSYLLESPHHSRGLAGYNDVINWTATYRRDSTIVAPYEKFVHFKNFTKLPDVPSRDYAKGKTKAVAWFVSNCHAGNGRHEYVRELSKYIPVHIYGPCGEYTCPRSKSHQCFDMLNKDYKFYLAFENSNCRDYITEKLYWNALWNDIVPVVMGAAPEDYIAVAPPHSYIHVDDYESPRELAQYLHTLMGNDTLYNQYYRWKGTGEFINTKFWCRMCRMVHEADFHRTWYQNVDNWWRGTGVCVGPKSKGWATWREYPDANDLFIKAKQQLVSQSIQDGA